jgi:hypothetical protein
LSSFLIKPAPSPLSLSLFSLLTPHLIRITV